MTTSRPSVESAFARSFVRSRQSIAENRSIQIAFADAVEAGRQDVNEKAADELVRAERHGFVSRAAIGAIILVPEGDAVVVRGDQPAVGDRDAMGMAREASPPRVHRTEALRRGTTRSCAAVLPDDDALAAVALGAGGLVAAGCGSPVHEHGQPRCVRPGRRRARAPSPGLCRRTGAQMKRHHTKRSMNAYDPQRSRQLGVITAPHIAVNVDFASGSKVVHGGM